MLDKFLLNLIMFCHFLLVCFVLFIPFTNNYYLILLHTIIVPFIMVHWYLNDNTCVLSEIEKRIRANIHGEPIDEDDCFTCRLINPIYDFKSNYEQYSKIIYFVTILLWTIGFNKLYLAYKMGKIESIHDLLKIKWNDIIKYKN